MKIAVDVRSLMEGRHSGVEQYAVQVIRKMIEIAPTVWPGEKVEWHLFYNSARRVDLPVWPDEVRVHAFRWPNKLFNLTQFLLQRPCWDVMLEKRIGSKPDVFFVPNIRLLPLCRMVPVVVTVHDLSYELFPEFYSWQRRVWHKLVRPRDLIRLANRVVAVSQMTKDDIVRLYGVSEEKVKVVHSGVDHMEDNQDKTEKRKFSLPEKFLLYLGTLEPRKNIISVIEAFLAIADEVPHHLIIAGEKGWLSRGLKRTVELSGARERIHMIGFVTEKEKINLYKRADLLVYPSFYEGFGFPPLESLLKGTPVITSHNSSLPEVVGEWATMIDPYDVSELALVMRELLLNRSTVSSEVRRAIRERFSWEKTARETLVVLWEAVKQQ